MGSTSVNDVGNLFGGLSTMMQTQMATKISNNVSTSTGSASESFANALMNKNQADIGLSTGSMKDTQMSQKPATESEKTSDRIAGEDKVDARKTSTSDEKTEESSKSVKSEKTDNGDKQVDNASKETGELSQEEIEEASEVIATIADQFANQVADILGISIDELKDLLGEMNLTATDLLDSQNLNAFALSAMKVEDSLTLLTDETKYSQLQDIEEALSELLNSDTEISEDTIGQLLAKLEDATKAVSNNPKDNITVQTKAEESGNAPVIADSKEDITSDVEAVTTEDGQTLGAESLIKSGRRNSENSENENQSQQNAFSGAQSLNQNFDVNIQNVTENIQTFESNLDAQDIANQILDYMKAQVKPDMQTLEMQLHPASLGNIQINLANKDGNLTASFIAQDEQVKAVLENQMIQLQERFEEQGIKVTAIEVTVSTNNFDQNLAGQNSQQQEEEDKPRRVRRLQIGNDFGMEDLEELSEEDRLAAEMMAANGNTVDLQA